MWFAYFDESKEDNKFFVYSALIVDSAQWNAAFDAVKNMRKTLRDARGVFLRQELHAWKFASGKGRIAARRILKDERADIFARILKFTAQCGFFKIISGVNSNEFYAFDRIINRINRTAEANDKQVIFVCDEGQEVQFTRRIRKMRVHNPIPSNRGAWDDTGAPTRNITIDRFIEDPFFKNSESSYFIQLVDFCAYALLRMERPIDSRSALGYNEMYKLLEPIVVKACNQNDPRGLGIIR
jgi:hypothetical protein